jgi:hypothetical protein
MMSSTKSDADSVGTQQKAAPTASSGLEMQTKEKCCDLYLIDQAVVETYDSILERDRSFETGNFVKLKKGNIRTAMAERKVFYSHFEPVRRALSMLGVRRS